MNMYMYVYNYVHVGGQLQLASDYINNCNHILFGFTHVATNS